VGRDIAIFCAQIGVIFSHGLFVENVDARARDPTLVQRLAERLLLDHAASRGIDDDRSRLFFLERKTAYEIFRFEMVKNNDIILWLWMGNLDFLGKYW
jgi:hypothetical protein